MDHLRPARNSRLAGNILALQGTFGLLRVKGNMDLLRLSGYDFLFIYECMPMLF